MLSALTGVAGDIGAGVGDANAVTCDDAHEEDEALAAEAVVVKAVMSGFL